jgi:hypothetical protein
VPIVSHLDSPPARAHLPAALSAQLNDWGLRQDARGPAAPPYVARPPRGSGLMRRRTGRSRPGDRGPAGSCGHRRGAAAGGVRAGAKLLPFPQATR